MARQGHSVRCSSCGLHYRAVFDSWVWQLSVSLSSSWLILSWGFGIQRPQSPGRKYHGASGTRRWGKRPYIAKCLHLLQSSLIRAILAFLWLRPLGRSHWGPAQVKTSFVRCPQMSARRRPYSYPRDFTGKKEDSAWL